MSRGQWMTKKSLDHPKALTAAMVGLTLLVAALALLPNVYPPAARWLNTITVDTDPENMLSEDEPVRVFHDRMKERYDLNDMVVVGVVNNEHPEGVFNPSTLEKVWKLTAFAKTLQYDSQGKPLDLEPEPLPSEQSQDANDAGDQTAPQAPTAPKGLPEGLGGGGSPDLPDGIDGGDGSGPSLPPGIGGDSSADGNAAPSGQQPSGSEDLPTPEPGAGSQGVIVRDMIAPSTVDKIIPTPGGIRFSWLMPYPPETQADANAVRRAAQRIPFLNGTLVSEDGKMLAIYLPLSRKDLSHDVYLALQEKISELGGPEDFHITGLPVAEDTFGYEMFVQMAISAPTAMLVIFLLMLVFFRKLVLIVSPMIVAMVCVVLTMGSLVVAGFPVHIMSSMIPIFIMPIAVLDSIHIISEFFEKYQATRDRRQTMIDVMDSLFAPMLYTSLTSAAGFASLALTPIPPVQVFGVFVAMGVLAAWLLTVTFIPAFVMFIPERSLENFGARHDAEAGEAHPGLLGRLLRGLGRGTYRYAKPIIAATAVVLAVAGWGISRINVNDNPVKWFEPSHPIRVADDVLNDHFGGTYMAYLSLDAKPQEWNPRAYAEELARRLRRQADRSGKQSGNPQETDVYNALADKVVATADGPHVATAPEEFFSRLLQVSRRKQEDRVGDDDYAWSQAETFLEQQRQVYFETFKDPAVLRWMSDLQASLPTTEHKGRTVVGKSNSIADIVRTINRDLHVSSPTYVPPTEDPNYTVPDTSPGVAQTLLQYENSHRPYDLWHLITKDYNSASLWVQLTSGDNQDMSAIVRHVRDYVAENPPPRPIEHAWFGLTYINVEWQERMVWGMLQSFAGSFLVVFLLMTILFRSALWGLLSMVPLTVTIAAIYGALGIVGKDYDMPTAVLSSLTLGLAVDFAIHFLARTRVMVQEQGSWEAAAPNVFGEPARAIMRNIIVIAAGFLPLLLAPLVPYQTVGMLLATILLVSGVATLLILPALVRLLEKPLFAAARTKAGPTCVCGTCVAAAAAAVALLALNAHQWLEVPLTTLTIVAVVAVPVAAAGCALMSRRDKCNVKTAEEGQTPTPPRKIEE
ncbi:MAG: efflux RND transporter permease subunit [Phycisphaerae bacterium]